MNIFAGNFSVKQDMEVPNIDYDIIKISAKNFFIMWGSEEISDQTELGTFLAKNFGELESTDISIDSEVRVEILADESLWESYECVVFTWPSVEISEILERFADSWDVLCVREGNISQRFWNREVVVDFMY